MKKTIIFLFALLAATGLYAQTSVSGTVIDESGEPLIGVSILVEGTSSGTVTDFDGNYMLTAADNATLVFSYMGYQTERIAVAGKTTINLTMKQDDKVLDEVVVVGYGVAKSKDLTAPITNVKGSDLSKQIASSPMGALQGKVSGVQVTQSGAPGSSPDVKIRGVGSIGDYAKPLYVVDGAFVDNIDFLSAEDIESLTILKDASAAAIYGVRAANGVVLVTTKKGEFGRVNVSYKGYVGVQVPTNIMKLANKAQYVELRNMAFQNTKGYVPVSESDYPGDTDWYATLTKNALIHNHALDVSGATDKTNYSVGVNYFYQDGIMNYGASNYDRLNFRARVDQKATSWLNVGLNNIFSNYRRTIPNDDAYFKAFVSDTGLLMAMYPIVTMREFLNDNLDSRKGAIYENLAGVLIHKAGFPLYYFANGEKHLEIDFLIEGADGLILYEEKSTNGKMAASRAVMTRQTPYTAAVCYKIIENNFGDGAFYTSIPQFCAPFLLDEIKEKIYNF